MRGAAPRVASASGFIPARRAQRPLNHATGSHVDVIAPLLAWPCSPRTGCDDHPGIP